MTHREIKDLITYNVGLDGTLETYGLGRIKWKIKIINRSIRIRFRYYTTTTSIPDVLVPYAINNFCHLISLKILDCEGVREIINMPIIIEEFYIIFETDNHFTGFSLGTMVPSKVWFGLIYTSHRIINIISQEINYNPIINCMPNLRFDFKEKLDTAINNFNTAFKLTCITHGIDYSYSELEIYVVNNKPVVVDEKIVYPHFKFDFLLKDPSGQNMNRNSWMDVSRDINKILQI